MSYAIALLPITNHIMLTMHVMGKVIHFDEKLITVKNIMRFSELLINPQAGITQMMPSEFPLVDFETEITFMKSQFVCFRVMDNDPKSQQDKDTLSMYQKAVTDMCAARAGIINPNDPKAGIINPNDPKAGIINPNNPKAFKGPCSL